MKGDKVMKKSGMILILLALVISLGACGGGKKEYKDGTYQGEAMNEEQGGGTKVTLTIEEGKITECQMVATDKEGNPKDENYGKESGGANFEKAQLAVIGMKQYPELLIEAQDIEGVDAVAGATVSHKEFCLAVKEALKEAEK